MSRAFIALLVAACLLAAGTAAVAATRRGPNLTLVAVEPKELGGGAKVVRQRAIRSPGYDAAFERELEFGSGAVGRSVLSYLSVTVELARGADTARADLETVRAGLSTREGRIAVVRAMEDELRRTLGKSLKAAAMGTIRYPKIGAGAIVAPIAVTTTGGRLHVVVSYLRVDRLLATMSIVGLPVAAADNDGILRLTARKARAQLSPIAVSPPSIAGAAVVGVQLIASSGSWSNGVSSYSYRWSRCDTRGEACTPIPGATQPSYTVVAFDAGFTLRVKVSARNGSGAATAVSPPTAVVVTAPA
jgi:hypothetical protein